MQIHSEDVTGAIKIVGYITVRCLTLFVLFWIQCLKLSARKWTTLCGTTGPPRHHHYWTQWYGWGACPMVVRRKKLPISLQVNPTARKWSLEWMAELLSRLCACIELVRVRNRDLKISRSPLKSQAQGTSLFTSVATNHRGCPKSIP